MNRIKKIIHSAFSSIILYSILSTSAQAWDKGIYLTQYMAEKPDKLDYFIRESKASGINTFIIDHEYSSSHYAKAIAKVKAAGIKVVTRIVIFSDGGNAKLVRSKEHWEKRYKLIEEAIKAGSDTIQLDYIRYSSKEPANPQHAKDIHVVIKWFKEKINKHGVPMEIDIFGEVSYYPSMHIGQDLKLFADSVDGVNPMVYPSHFWPYQKYSAEPYKTIKNSLNALVGHFDDKPPFKVHAFIEAANYHYIKKTSNAEKQKYLLQQIRAVEDAKNVSGWYVWSANNVYDNLFHVLKNNKTKSASEVAKKAIPVNTPEKSTAVLQTKKLEQKPDEAVKNPNEKAPLDVKPQIANNNPAKNSVSNVTPSDEINKLSLIKTAEDLLLNTKNGKKTETAPIKK